MKHITIAVLVLACSAFGQDWAVAKCRKTFEERHKQLAVHFGSIADSRTDQFKSSVGRIPTRDLIRWQEELGTCVKIDGERILYSAVSRQLNEVLNERFVAYVLDARQALAFSEWEGKKQREQKSSTKPAGPTLICEHRSAVQAERSVSCFDSDPSSVRRR
jgi:hypothetical protein